MSFHGGEVSSRVLLGCDAIVVGYQSFKGPCCLHLQHGPLERWYPTTLHGVTTQKTLVFSIERESNHITPLPAWNIHDRSDKLCGRGIRTYYFEIWS